MRANQYYRALSRGLGSLSYTPLLDVYGTNAFCAHSVRKERTAYSGPCVRALRASDSAELDIGFLPNGLIDTISLLAFAGANTVYVKTFYDQTGNGNNLNLATSLGSILVDSGTLQEDSGTPVFHFKFGVQSNYTMSHSGELNNISSKSVFMALLYPAGQSGFNLGTRGTTGTGWLLRNFKTSNSLIFFFAGGSGNVSATPVKNSERYLFNLTHSDVANGLRIVRDNTLIVSGRPTGGTNRAIYELGLDAGPSYSLMRMFNHIIYSADKSADESGINGNINAYFNCY